MSENNENFPLKPWIMVLACLGQRYLVKYQRKSANVHHGQQNIWHLRVRNVNKSSSFMVKCTDISCSKNSTQVLRVYLWFCCSRGFLRRFLLQDCPLSPEAPLTPEPSVSPASPARSASLSFAWRGGNSAKCNGSWLHSITVQDGISYKWELQRNISRTKSRDLIATFTTEAVWAHKVCWLCLASLLFSLIHPLGSQSRANALIKHKDRRNKNWSSVFSAVYVILNRRAWDLNSPVKYSRQIKSESAGRWMRYKTKIIFWAALPLT